MSANKSAVCDWCHKVFTGSAGRQRHELSCKAKQLQLQLLQAQVQAGKEPVLRLAPPLPPGPLPAALQAANTSRKRAAEEEAQPGNVEDGDAMEWAQADDGDELQHEGPSSTNDRSIVVPQIAVRYGTCGGQLGSNAGHAHAQTGDAATQQYIIDKNGHTVPIEEARRQLAQRQGGINSFSPGERVLMEVRPHLGVKEYSKLLQSVLRGELRPDKLRFESVAHQDTVVSDALAQGTWERLERSIEYEAMIVGVKQRLVYTYEVYKLSDAYIEQALSKMYTARPFTEVSGDEYWRSRPNFDRWYLLQDGAWLREKERKADACFIDEQDVNVLAYGCYSDGSQVCVEGTRFHPWRILPAFWPDYERNKMGAHTDILLLPVVDPLPLKGLKATSVVLADLRRAVLHGALELGLRRLKELSHSGMHIDGKFFVPLPVLVQSDRQEQHSLAMIRQSADVRHRLLKEDFDSLEAPLVPRTEAAALAIIERARMATTVAQCNAILSEYDLTDSFQSALAGFNLTNLYELFNPDLLHTIHLGLYSHLINLKVLSSVLNILLEKHVSGNGANAQQLTKRLTPKVWRQQLLNTLQAAVAATPSFPGLRLPKRGLESDRLEASHMKSLALVLPVALTALAEVDGVTGLIGSLVDAVEFEIIYTASEHTAESIADLEAATRKLQDNLLQRFKVLKSFKYPKMAMLRQMPRTPQWLGDASLADTASGEMHHKIEKAAFHYTNNRGDKTKQMIAAAQRISAAQVAAARTAADGCHVQRLHVNQKATQEAATTMRGITICYLDMEQPAQSAALLPHGSEAAGMLLEMASSPELMDFGRLFQLHLAGKPAWNTRNRDATKRASLPHSEGKVIVVHSAIAVPRQRRAGDPVTGVTLHASYTQCAAAGSRGERSWDYAIVRGPAGDDVWIGAALLLFTYTLPAQPNRRLKAAYVRWLLKTQHTAATRSTRMQRLRWEFVKHPMTQSKVPRCDVVAVESIVGRALVQPDPTEQGCFFYNHLAVAVS